MAEQNSAQEKTEPASEYKLRKSRQEGQVPRSRDVATMVSLLASLLILRSCSDYIYDGFANNFSLAYVNFSQSEVTPDDVALVLLHSMLNVGAILLPLLLAPILVIVFSLIPGGWTFASKNFSPQLSRLDPIRGLGRIVSLQNWTELLKSILKVTALVAVAAWQIFYAVPQLLALQQTNVYQAIGGALSLVFNLALVLLLVFVLFAVIDVPLQRFFFLKKMRMTKQERKEEQKTLEGRPEVKARIKQLQRQIAQRQINRVLKDADVVIVNPTHFAVALKYDPKKAEAPYVVTKGVDEIALYIRKLAKSLDLEIVELPPLARAIYATTQINQQIPAPLYTAVAHVLSYIVQLKAWKQGRRSRQPTLASNLPIPEALVNRI